MKRAVWAGIALVGLVIAVTVGGCPRQQVTEKLNQRCDCK